MEFGTDTNQSGVQDFVSEGAKAVPSVEVPSLPVTDNQNFDVQSVEKKESFDVDSSLLNEEDGVEELDFGDGDEHKEDMISFQIEESDMAIVETEKKEDSGADNTQDTKKEGHTPEKEEEG